MLRSLCSNCWGLFETRVLPAAFARQARLWLASESEVNVGGEGMYVLIYFLNED